MKKITLFILLIFIPMVLGLGETLVIETNSGTVTINTSIISGTNISCTDIIGGSDTDYCTDGGGAGGNVNGSDIAPGRIILDGIGITSWAEVNLTSGATSGVPTTEGIYGEFYNYTPAGYTQPVPTIGTWFQVIGLLNGSVNNVTLDSGHQWFTIETAGVYQVHWVMSFSGGLSDTYLIAPFLNNATQVTACTQHRKLGTGGDVGSASGACLVDFQVNQNLSLKIRNQDAAADATIFNVDFTVERLIIGVNNTDTNTHNTTSEMLAATAVYGGNTTAQIRAVQLVNTSAEMLAVCSVYGGNTTSQIRAVQLVNTTAEIQAAQTVNTTAEMLAATAVYGGNTTEQIWGVIDNGTVAMNTTFLNFVEGTPTNKYGIIYIGSDMIATNNINFTFNQTDNSFIVGQKRKAVDILGLGIGFYTLSNFNSEDGSDTGTSFRKFANTTTGTNLAITRSRGDITTPNQLGKDDEHSSILFGTENESRAFGYMAAITVSVPFNHTATSTPGRLAIGTTPNNSLTSTAYLAIESEGAVNVTSGFSNIDGVNGYQIIGYTKFINATYTCVDYPTNAQCIIKNGSTTIYS